MTAPPLYDGEVPAAGSPFFASPLATHDTQVESMQMQRRMHDNAVHETPRFHATPVTQLSNQRSSPMPRRLSLSEESPPAPPGFRCASPYERISSPTTDGAVLPTLSSMLHQNWSPQPWPRQSTAGASPTVPSQRLPPTHRSPGLSISANSLQGPTSSPWHAGTTVKAESLSFHGYSPINTPRSEVTDSQMELSPRERSGSISAYSYTSVSAQEESSFDEVASTPGSPPASGAKKSSRYLREMDRRAILERLARGEKQATLAKEYKVSRAAICNLFKHRDEVMARTDEDPFAKHPKKRKNKKTLKSRRSRSLRLATAPNVHGGDGRTLVTPPSATSTVIQVLSDSVLLLLTAMSDRRSSAKDFRRASERVLWLLIEEALSSVPIKLTQVTMDTDSKIMGVATEHPPCAISMEQHSSPMLEVFQLLESDRPFGQIRILDAVTNACSLVDTHLPATLKYHNVFLFDVAVVSSDTVCAMIECAKARGALEVMIYVVALFISADVVETLQDKFPHVRVVTTQIESNILEAQKNRRSCVDVVLGRFDQVYRTQYTLV